MTTEPHDAAGRPCGPRTGPAGPFDLYVAVDWAGARAPGYAGVAVAKCGPGREAPVLVAPPGGRGRWTRSAACEWLTAQTRAARILVGIDAAFAFPFIDLGAYFPASVDSPSDAQRLWALVESACAGEGDLGATDFPADPRFDPYFFKGRPPGARFQRRFRLAEHLCRETSLANAQSVFHLVGANQVGKSALSSMRLLKALTGYARWPFERMRRGDSVVVEIYTALFLGQAGAGREKLRGRDDLERALTALGCDDTSAVPAQFNDHESDVLVSAAGLRAYTGEPALWRPTALSRRVAKTEGWIFGVG